MANLLNIKAKRISDSPTSLDRLEAALDRIEAALTEREAEVEKLRRIKVAATAALADLDALVDGSAATDATGAGPAIDRLPMTSTGFN